MNHLYEDVIQAAESLGFAHAVLLPVDQILAYAPFETAYNSALDPRNHMPTAKSVLVASMPFGCFNSWPKDCGEVSAFYFASQKAYVALRTLEKSLLAQGIQVDGRQLLPAKTMGAISGLGVFGKNTLLRNAKWGSQFTIHTLITDVPAPPLIQMADARSCGDCTRCISACPTGALSAAGNIDPMRCLRNYMMKRIPEQFRRIMQNGLLGCEICQRACPLQPVSVATDIPVEKPEDFLIERLLCEPDRRAIAARIGSNYARPRKLQAQAAILSGNSGDRAYLPILEKLVSNQDEVVAEHARWAMQRIQELT